MATHQHSQQWASLLGRDQTVSFIHHDVRAATFAPRIQHINKQNHSAHGLTINVFERAAYRKSKTIPPNYSIAHPAMLTLLYNRCHHEWMHVGKTEHAVQTLQWVRESVWKNLFTHRKSSVMHPCVTHQPPKQFSPSNMSQGAYLMPQIWQVFCIFTSKSPHYRRCKKQCVCVCVTAHN